MFTDRYGVPTDDSARDYTGTMDEFGSDECDADDGWRGGPKCARESNDWRGCGCDHTGRYVGPGCRECNPPDWDGKPYGWGLERFEDPALERANREAKALRPVAMYTTAGAYAHEEPTGQIVEVGEPGSRRYVREMRVTVGTPAFPDTREYRDMLWRAYSTWDAKLGRLSERMWDKLCDNCATHPEAVRKYAKWAAKKTGVRIEKYENAK